ncbi:hypothetical protein ACTJ2N_000634 [Vibrio fluvialis]
MSNSNEVDFTTILDEYYECDDQEKRWKETCAALTLIKHTFTTDSGNSLCTLERHIQIVANGIRVSLERE